jgi:hypothetical protein
MPRLAHLVPRSWAAVLGMLVMACSAGCAKQEFPFAYYDQGVTFTGSRGIIHKVLWVSPGAPAGPLVGLLNGDGKRKEKPKRQVHPSRCPVVVHLEQRDLGDREFSSANTMRALGGEVRNEYEGSFEITLQREGFWIVASYEGEQLTRLSVLVSSRESGKKEISVDRKRVPLPLRPDELFQRAGEPRSYQVWPKAKH